MPARVADYVFPMRNRAVRALTPDVRVREDGL